MNIIAVDDERRALLELVQAIKEVSADAEVTGFPTAQSALDYAREQRIDVAFLDVEMKGMDGLALARALKDINGFTNIVFVTGYSKYMKDAFGLRASGYIMKPVEPAAVAEELKYPRTPIKEPEARIKIHCFGHFEVFVDNVPVSFKRSKSKECLAYLVDRMGSALTKKQLAAVLLPDEDYSRSTQSYAHIIISGMMSDLKAISAEDIIRNEHNQYSVNPTAFECDFYAYNKGELWAVNSYRGEYMTNYDWAEFTTGLLSGQ